MPAFPIIQLPEAACQDAKSNNYVSPPEPSCPPGTTSSALELPRRDPLWSAGPRRRGRSGPAAGAGAWIVQLTTLHG